MATATVAPPVPDPSLPPYIVHDSKVWKIMRTAGFYGYTPCSVPTNKPWMEWEGGKISLSVWGQILAFFEWSQKEFKSETQVRLYYHRTNKRWATWAYPQRPNGMTTNEIADHPNVAAQRAQFPEPWMLLGTVHHHCTSSAFQSGTDKNNEENQEGIHITVGKIGSEEYDLHARVIVRGVQFDAAWDHWFELPEINLDLPGKIKTQIMEYYLKKPPAADTPFPEAWKTNCEKFVPTQTHMGYGASGYGASGSSIRSGGTISRHEIPFTSDLRSQFSPDETQFMAECRKLMVKENVSHSKMDNIICVVSEPTSLSTDDRKLRDEVQRLATMFHLSSQRIDQLFDCWDFETVLAELDKSPIVRSVTKTGDVTVVTR